MLVDLHAHYPMHVIPDEQPRRQQRPGAFEEMLDWDARRKAMIIDRISRRFNYQGQDLEKPSVTINGMVAGNVRIALSVLYQPFDEIKLSANPPEHGTDHVFEQLRAVEKSVDPGVAGHRPDVLVVKNLGDLEEAAAERKYALVHCIEGGFSLGRDIDAIEGEVKALAEAGIAYITVAHLFWRHYATNVPALPFMPDWLYQAVFFWRPWWGGLSELGCHAIEEMIRNRILVDVSHMSPRSLKQTLEIVGRHPGTPVMATHSAVKLERRSPAYNWDRTQVEAIAAVDGVIGLILCSHYIAHGRPTPTTPEQSVDLLCEHIDKIREWTGDYRHVAIGSDLDGFIKPALAGLEDMDFMDRIEKRLGEHYDPADVELITSGNALRMLRYRFG